MVSVKAVYDRLYAIDLVYSMERSTAARFASAKWWAAELPQEMTDEQLRDASRESMVDDAPPSLARVVEVYMKKQGVAPYQTRYAGMVIQERKRRADRQVGSVMLQARTGIATA
jgi:uncharacterized protein YciW